MVRRCLFPTFVITSAGALPACAHPGHLDTLAGHDHWVAGAAIGLAIALGIYGALKGKKDAQADPDEVEEDTPEESPA